MPSPLSEIIRKKLKTSVDDAATLEQGLFDALEHQKKSQEMFVNSASTTAFRNEVKRILNSLEKINDALKILGPQNCQILDNVYYSANNKDNLLMTMEPDIMSFENSGLMILGKRLQKTMDLALEGIPALGKGNAKKKAKKYIYGIEKLAEHFKKVFPNNKISSTKSGKFYKYVEIWFQHLLEEDEGDLRRHIKNATSGKI